MTNSIYWFEIPAEDIDRAIKFYGEIFGAELAKMEVNKGYPTAMLPSSIGGGGSDCSGRYLFTQRFWGFNIPGRW